MDEQIANADGLYLHFLDRELVSSVPSGPTSAEIGRALRILTVLLAPTYFCGLSAIWENDSLSREVLDELELLYVMKVLRTVSHDQSLGEFLESRRISYEFDQYRYQNYFSSNVPHLSWARPDITKKQGSTGPLVRYLFGWADAMKPPNDYLTVSQLAQPVKTTLASREDRAVTFSLFKPSVAELRRPAVAESIIRRKISEGFTSEYMDILGADIVTGLPGLGQFDALARHFPFTDIQILGELNAFLGLHTLVDTEATALEFWAPYVGACDSDDAIKLRLAVQWLLNALHYWVKMSPVMGVEYTQSGNDKSIARLRIRRQIQNFARISARRVVPRGEDPQVTLVASVQSLRWLANEMGRHNSLIGSKLEGTRWMVEIDSVDVLVLNSTEIEFEVTQAALEECVGSPGRLRYGNRLTYWDYGPMGGATISLVRSSMGSGGAGGATTTVAEGIRERRPKSVIAVGIAFGVDEEKQPIGTVLVSSKVTPYELQRVGSTGSGAKVVIHRAPTPAPSVRLLSRFRDSRIDKLGFKVQVGELLSGEKLIDNRAFRSELLNQFPEAVGGEMEAAGVHAAADAQNVEWVIVKAVCDYGMDKSADKKGRQRLAASNAAAALVHVWRNGGFST